MIFSQYLTSINEVILSSESLGRCNVLLYYYVYLLIISFNYLSVHTGGGIGLNLVGKLEWIELKIGQILGRTYPASHNTSQSSVELLVGFVE